MASPRMCPALERSLVEPTMLWTRSGHFSNTILFYACSVLLKASKHSSKLRNLISLKWSFCVLQIPSGLERQLDRDGLLFDPRSDPIHVSANMCNHWPTGESKLPLSHISQRLKLQAMFPKILPVLEPQVLHDWRAFALPILVLTVLLFLCGESRYLKKSMYLSW